MRSLLLLLALVPLIAFAAEEKSLLTNSTLSKLSKFKYNKPENDVSDKRLDELVVCKLNVIKFYSSVYADNMSAKRSHICSEFKLAHSVQSLLKQFTQPSSIAIDIGSYKGLVSLFMSRFVKSDGIVISFEPSVKNHRNLLNNIHLNKRKNVIAILAALGNETKKASLVKTKKSHDDSRIISALNDGHSLELVDLTTLDTFKVLSNVSIIYIDVHSLEDSVLQGAVETIKRSQPVVIVSISTFAADCVPRYTETVKSLSLLSYKLYRHGSSILALPKDTKAEELSDFKEAKADGSDAKSFCADASAATTSPDTGASTTRLAGASASSTHAATASTGTATGSTGSTTQSASTSGPGAAGTKTTPVPVLKTTTKA